MRSAPGAQQASRQPTQRCSTKENFMHRFMRATALTAAMTLASSIAAAQEENTVATNLEFGAIFTSGNSDDQNVKFKGTVDWNRGDWIYGFSSDGFRSSKNSELNAQRLYHVGRAGHTINDLASSMRESPMKTTASVALIVSLIFPSTTDAISCAAAIR
jgi:hypothetical protein